VWGFYRFAADQLQHPACTEFTTIGQRRIGLMKKFYQGTAIEWIR
jgi:hypothetical protein